jgi:hypothetical protein
MAAESRWLADTATVTVQGSRSGSTRRARGGDFYLATSGDLYLATSGDFLMATDTGWTALALPVIIGTNLWLISGLFGDDMWLPPPKPPGTALAWMYRVWQVWILAHWLLFAIPGFIAIIMARKTQNATHRRKAILLSTAVYLGISIFPVSRLAVL